MLPAQKKNRTASPHPKTALLEAGEMVLRPDIVKISVPCQGRSVARRLAEWADELHPHHNLWKLQAKLVSLTRPKVVLMENVPWRDESA